MHRLTASLAALVLLGTIGLGFSLTYLYNAISSPGSDRVDPHLYARKLGGHLASSLDSFPDQESFVRSWNNQNNIQIQIEDITQFSFSQNILHELQDSGVLALEDEAGVYFNFHLQRSGKVLTIQVPGQDGSNQQGLKAIFTALFYSGLLLLVLVWLAPLLYRLRKLRTAAVTFGKGQLDARIPVSSVSYISDIEAEFNRMADRIKNLLEDVRLLSSALSHEMRTPLSKLRMGIDLLEEQEDPIIRQRYQSRLSATADQLTALVEQTLEFSRMEFALGKADRGRVDLGSVIYECVSEFETLHPDIEVRTTLRHCSVEGNESYLKLMVNNLLDNAARYGNGRVLVDLECDGRVVTLLVDDDGSGFDPESVPYVLAPFQRGKESHKNRGFGLGLAVVHRIASWHGAQVILEKSDNLGGARVIIKFEFFR